MARSLYVRRRTVIHPGIVRCCGESGSSAIGAISSTARQFFQSRERIRLRTSKKRKDESDERAEWLMISLTASSSMRDGVFRRDSRFDYLLVESTGSSESLRVAEPRLGRRTALTFPLRSPPQKN